MYQHFILTTSLHGRYDAGGFCWLMSLKRCSSLAFAKLVNDFEAWASLFGWGFWWILFLWLAFTPIQRFVAVTGVLHRDSSTWLAWIFQLPSKQAMRLKFSMAQVAARLNVGVRIKAGTETPTAYHAFSSPCLSRMCWDSSSYWAFWMILSVALSKVLWRSVSLWESIK